MRKALVCLGVLAALVVALPPAISQERERPERIASQPHPSTPRANQGHVPPPPKARTDHTVPGRPDIDERNRINNHPHVNHDEWFGHDRPDDPRFHLDHPFAHGHFEHFGPTYRYTVVRVDPNLHRFWFPGGLFFEVAPFDWVYASEWCWNCGDDFVVYEDPDHIGWYLLYNVHTGAYIHVQYLGS